MIKEYSIMRFSQYFGVAIWLSVALLSSSVSWAFHAGYCINHSASMPFGLYQTEPLIQPLHRGSLVLICPPKTPVFETAYERGYIGKGICPGNREGLLKPIAAIPGDTVTVTENGIVINNRMIPNTKIKHYDSLHRNMNPLKRGTYTVNSGTVWLISNFSSRSFDSRYFGPIRLDSIRGNINPIFTWGNPS